MNIIAYLKKNRKALSMRKLADKCGIPIATFHGIAHGDEPSHRNGMKIIKITSGEVTESDLWRKL